MKLTKNQKEIVELSTGEHLVLAPPGTGKTEILTHRVVYALNSTNTPTENISTQIALL